MENENIHVTHVTVPDDQNEQSTENVRVACLIKRDLCFYKNWTNVRQGEIVN